MKAVFQICRNGFLYSFIVRQLTSALTGFLEGVVLQRFSPVSNSHRSSLAKVSNQCGMLHVWVRSDPVRQLLYYSF